MRRRRRDRCPGQRLPGQWRRCAGGRGDPAARPGVRRAAGVGVWAMRTAYVGWAEQRLSLRQFLGVVVRFIALYLVLTFFLLS